MILIIGVRNSSVNGQLSGGQNNPRLGTYTITAQGHR